MINECGNTVTLLEAIGFEYSGQLSLEAEFWAELGECCEIEEYLGWEIQSEPVFAVIHQRTGHAWMPLFEETVSVERVKVLIRKGFEMDCEKAMEVGR